MLWGYRIVVALGRQSFNLRLVALSDSQFGEEYFLGTTLGLTYENFRVIKKF